MNTDEIKKWLPYAGIVVLAGLAIYMEVVRHKRSKANTAAIHRLADVYEKALETVKEGPTVPIAIIRAGDVPPESHN